MRRKQLFSILGYIGLFVLFLWISEEYFLGHRIIKPHLYAIGIFILGILMFFLVLLSLKISKREEYNELLKEFSFLTLNLRVSVLLSLSLSFVFIGITAFFNEIPYNKVQTKKPELNSSVIKVDSTHFTVNTNIQPETENKNFIEENIFDILGIVLSFISIFVIVRGLFDKILPITTIDKLLTKVTDDINEHKNNENSTFYFVYPALNIGHYRSLKYSETEQIYQRFTSAIENFLSHRHEQRNIKIVTYSKDLIQPLYKKYCEMLNEPEVDKITNECANEADKIYTYFEKNTTSFQRNVKCYNISPIGFPQHFIIIGNIVYLINTFGLPIYNNNQFNDPLPNEANNFQEKLAKLYVYRQEDKLLAELLKDQIDALTEPQPVVSVQLNSPNDTQPNPIV